MNKKLQDMWDSAHEIPKGTYVPEGTALVYLDEDDLSTELVFYETDTSAYWPGTASYRQIRSVEPLPDSDDTGTLTVHSGEGFIVLVDTYDDRCYDLTKSQALNLARKLTEATNE